MGSNPGLRLFLVARPEHILGRKISLFMAGVLFRGQFSVLLRGRWRGLVLHALHPPRKPHGHRTRQQHHVGRQCRWGWGEKKWLLLPFPAGQERLLQFRCLRKRRNETQLSRHHFQNAPYQKVSFHFFSFSQEMKILALAC